jgi:hypothetical protein
MSINPSPVREAMPVRIGKAHSTPLALRQIQSAADMSGFYWEVPRIWPTAFGNEANRIDASAEPGLNK